jgi:putative DNA primase/helicase
MRRRLQLWPFTVTIPDSEVDGKLFDKLCKESPGVLRWAIEGFAQWQKCGLNPPKFIVDATKDYIDDQDLIGSWIEDCCVVDEEAWTSTIELHKSYTRWSIERNLPELWINTFSSMLEEKGFERTRPRVGGDKIRGFKGLRLDNDTATRQAEIPF